MEPDDLQSPFVCAVLPTGPDLPAANNTDGFDVIGLVMSRDLVTWQHSGDRAAFIPASRIDGGLLGVFDRQQMCAPGRPLEMGDELWFYYTGFKTRVPPYTRNADGSRRDPATLTPQENADLEDGCSAICLAVLRRDGFVSLDAPPEGGFVLTRPLRADGARLFLNVNAAGGGSARVEVLDEEGTAMDGFSSGDAALLTTNGVRVEARWRSGARWGQLHGRTIRLKIHLADASLYAFSAEEDEDH